MWRLVMRRIRRWGGLLGWCACSLQPLQADPGIRVGLSVPSSRQMFFRALLDGAQHYAAQAHGHLQLIVAPAAISAEASAQVDGIRYLLRAQVQALVVDPLETAPLLPVLQAALQQGVRVINVDNKLDARLLADNGMSIPYVGPGNYRGATLVADYLLQRLAPGSLVGIIDGPLETINNRARREAFIDAIRRHQLRLAAVEEGRWDVISGQAAARQLLQQYPQIQALLCANDMMAIGAQQMAAGHPHRVLISGYDNVPEVHLALQKGDVLATVDQHPAQQIGSALALAMQAVNQQQSQDSLPGIVQTPVGLVIHEP